MKKHLHKLLPAILIAFATSFMLYVYEPIITYSANIDDFWFDFKLMIPNITLYFIILFSVVLLIYSIIYLISLLLKRDKIYKIILIISFIVFTALYIQGVYLVGNLPVLDGTTIDWSSYTTDTIISCVVVFILIIAEIVLIRKTDIKKTVKINTYFTVVILVMISLSVISLFFKPNVFREKVVAVATNRNINNASTDKNFYIVLVDAVDSYEFSTIVENSDKYSQTFNDFSYYPDTVSGYTFTRDSIPFIFSALWNKNEMEFRDYSTKAFNESEIFKKLKDKQYNMNFYENEIIWNDRKSSEFSNINIYNNKVNQERFFKELSKYILFKYLPYPLKKYSKIETADFSTSKIDEEENYFEWSNSNAYKNIKENRIEKIGEKYFQFLHIEGGHVPFDYDEDVNIIPTDEGNYQKKLTATLNIIDTFIKRLKENNVYDNSVIVVMADHGYWNSQNNGRQNPILYIKGVNEHHEMITSEIPVSYEDLCDTFIKLLDDKKSTELFQNIDKDRIRRFIDNPAGGEDIMTEYEQRGKAWDRSAIYETGNKFNR